MALSSEEIFKYLTSIELFQSLYLSDLEKLIPDLIQFELPPQERFLKQGEPGDGLYIVTSGRLQATISDENNFETIVGEVGPGELIGEMDILAGGKRTATLETLEPTHLLKVPKAAFEDLLNEHRTLARQFKEILFQRWYHNQLAAILPEIFGPLDLPTLEDIEKTLEWVHLSRGEVLLEQGAQREDIYVVISGRLQASVAVNQETRIVGEVVSGEIVGEMAYLTGQPAAATVTAVRDTTLVNFPVKKFQKLMSDHPPLIHYLARQAINRLQSVQSAAVNPRHIALDLVLIPAGSQRNLTDFAQQLAHYLQPLGSTIVLTSRQLDIDLNLPGAAQAYEDDPVNIRLAMWLNEQELRHRFIVYVADSSPTNWTQRCLRQADQVVLVAQAGDNPAAFNSNYLPKNLTARRRLVLLHSDDEKLPQETIQWLSRHPVEMHHHVRRDNTADYARLARFVAGRAVGLTLSGGGARGFAHIGVIRALEAANVPIDLVGGTSMGSIMGAQYASGWDVETMMQRNRQLFKNNLLDYTLPFISLISGKRLTALFKKAFADNRFEDLWLPYYCISTNLSQSAMSVHRQGLVRHGLRASCGLPGLLPPFLSDGDILVEGMLINNLPVDVMRRLCGPEGTVIAADVSPPVDMNQLKPYGETLSGWRALWHKMNPLLPSLDLPSIIEIVQRAAEIGGIYGHKKLISDGIVDYYLRPPVENYELFNFKPLDEIVEKAYRYAQEAIGEWDFEA